MEKLAREFAKYWLTCREVDRKFRAALANSISFVMSESTHILLTIRAPVEHYPPSINQANIMVEHGFKVSIVQESKSSRHEVEVGLNSKVERYFINAGEAPSSLMRRAFKVLSFRRGVKNLVTELHPDIVWAYDADAAWLLGDRFHRLKPRLVWHFHEVPEKLQEGWTIKLANRYVWKNAGKADLIIFPDPGRAQVFSKDAQIDLPRIRIAANCPRPVVSPPHATLRQTLADRLPPQARVVLYHGAVGPDHGLEVAIKSMPMWPKNAFFVTKGRVQNCYASHLTELANSVGVAKRFILFDPGFQSIADHYAFVAGADVGWTVLEPISNAWKYSALASNKRFECMALGVPQISDNGALLPELIEGNGCGLCMPHDSVHAAAAGVSQLLTNESSRAKMSANARKLHLQRYNYDAQFQPILACLSYTGQPGNHRCG